MRESPSQKRLFEYCSTLSVFGENTFTGNLHPLGIPPKLRVKSPLSYEIRLKISILKCLGKVKETWMESLRSLDPINLVNFGFLYQTFLIIFLRTKLFAFRRCSTISSLQYRVWIGSRRSLWSDNKRRTFRASSKCESLFRAPGESRKLRVITSEGFVRALDAACLLEREWAVN